MPDYPTSVLPPLKGKRTKTSDKDRFYEWFLLEELKAPDAKLDRISRDDIRHVRTHAQLSSMVDYFIDLSKSSGDEFVIALDTEGSVPRTQPSIAEKASDEPALLQLAARVGKKQIVAVIQLYSKRDRADIFSEGEPTRLAEIFRIKNAIFAGKAIAGDIRKVARASGLSYEELGEILVDTAKMFFFADALSRDGEAMENWINDDVKALLGESSLKNFCQFVDPTRILDKSPHHCYKDNFTESYGPIRSSDLQYSSLDVLRTLDSVVDFSEQVGVAAKFFASAIAEPGVLKSIVRTGFEEVYRDVGEIFRRRQKISQILRRMSARY